MFYLQKEMCIEDSKIRPEIPFSDTEFAPFSELKKFSKQTLVVWLDFKFKINPGI